MIIFTSIWWFILTVSIYTDCIFPPSFFFFPTDGNYLQIFEFKIKYEHFFSLGVKLLNYAIKEMFYNWETWSQVKLFFICPKSCVFFKSNIWKTVSTPFVFVSELLWCEENPGSRLCSVDLCTFPVRETNWVNIKNIFLLDSECHWESWEIKWYTDKCLLA